MTPLNGKIGINFGNLLFIYSIIVRKIGLCQFIILAYIYPTNIIIPLISGHSSVVERLVANEKVEGSSPFARSKTKKYGRFIKKKMYTM